MKKLVCYFSGWFEIDADDVQLVDLSTEPTVTKSAAEFLNEGKDIKKLILADFEGAFRDANDGEFESLELSIEDDDV